MTMKNFQFSIFNFQKKGFTLIETMVAVAIVTLSVAGPLFTANSAIRGATTARAQLTASYLAQEGIEHVRMMRDNEFLTTYHEGGIDISATAWTRFLTNPVTDSSSISGCRTTASQSSVCMLETYPGTIAGTGSGLTLEPCVGDCRPLRLVNGIYTQKTNIGGDIMPFVRTIQVKDVPNATDDVQVISTVSWSYHGIPYAVKIYDHITPWQ
ncbi:MAG: type II secretion system protein [Candidatus Pacebacteria bacterium]|nr:type II secretion system protein [Candidatus Paceibacterota bacterium]